MNTTNHQFVLVLDEFPQSFLSESCSCFCHRCLCFSCSFGGENKDLHKEVEVRLASAPEELQTEEELRLTCSWTFLGLAFLCLKWQPCCLQGPVGILPSLHIWSCFWVLSGRVAVFLRTWGFIVINFILKYLCCIKRSGQAFCDDIPLVFWRKQPLLKKASLLEHTHLRVTTYPW